MPLLATAVGRSRAFSDPPRSHAQDGRQWSWNALLCHTLPSSPSLSLSLSLSPPPHCHTLFLLSLPPFISPCTGILWITYSGKTPGGNTVLRSEVQFLKSTLVRIRWNVKRKTNWIIKSVRLVNFLHWTHYTIKKNKTVKTTTFFNIVLQSFSCTLGKYSPFLKSVSEPC